MVNTALGREDALAKGITLTAATPPAARRRAPAIVTSLSHSSLRFRRILLPGRQRQRALRCGLIDLAQVGHQLLPPRHGRQGSKPLQDQTGRLRLRQPEGPFHGRRAAAPKRKQIQALTGPVSTGSRSKASATT